MLSQAAIAERLARLGVRDVFTFTSEDIVQLVAELDLRGIKVHHARHEHNAVGMADGYSRASGRVGIVLIGGGIGVTNAGNALLTAIKAHSRVLVITGETPGGSTDAARLIRKYIDQRGLLELLGARRVSLESPASIGADAEACFELAKGGGELLVMAVPDEVMYAEAGDAPSSISIAAAAPVPLAAADRDTIVELLRESWAARRPVILAGRGAVNAEAREELLRLGDATGALFATSIMAKELFAASPWSVGVSGTFSTPVASELLVQADLILAFGASLNYDTTLDRSLYGKARVIHIDNRRSALGRFGPADLAVVADARLAARDIADSLIAAGHRPESAYRTPDVAARIAAHVRDSGYTDRTGPAGIDNRALMAAFDRILPAERTVAIDGGVQQNPPVRHLGVPDPQGFIWPAEHGAIGCALGPALGAAVARPDRLTVLATGDGALMQALAELDTAVRYGLRFLVVLSNNGGLAAEVDHLKKHGYRGEQVLYANPSFEAVARSLGYEAVTVTTLAEVEALKDRIAALRGPMLIDCRVVVDRLEPPRSTFARAKASKAKAAAAV